MHSVAFIGIPRMTRPAELPGLLRLLCLVVDVVLAVSFCDYPSFFCVVCSARVRLLSKKTKNKPNINRETKLALTPHTKQVPFLSPR